VIAAAFEALAFSGFGLLSHHRANRRWLALAVTVLGVGLAAAVCVEGGHRGLVRVLTPMQEAVDQRVRDEQDVLDKRHRALDLEIAAIERRLREAAATRPDSETTNTSRQKAWLASYDATTELDRARLPTARNEKAALPLTVAARRAYPEWATYVVTVACVFFSLFGTTIAGAGSLAQRPSPRPTQVGAGTHGTPRPAPVGPNVIDLGTARERHDEDDRKALVKSLRKEGRSFRAIAKLTGVSSSTAERWAKQA
jgi:hypothetical protein